MTVTHSELVTQIRAYTEVEVPTRFIPCLTSGLAYYVSIKKAPERTALLKQLYEEEWQRASEEDRPRSSFFITPERGVI